MIRRSFASLLVGAALAFPAFFVPASAFASEPAELSEEQLKVTELYRNGNRLLNARRYAEAERNFLDALKIAPHISAIRHGLGLVYVQTEDYELAVLHLEEALRLEPTRVKTLYALAKAYMLAGESEKARQTYHKTIELRPGHERAHQDLAGIFYREKNWEQALYHLEKAREANPDSAHTQMLIGVTGLHSGRSDIALDAVTELRRIGEPDRARRLEYLIYAARQEGDGA